MASEPTVDTAGFEHFLGRSFKKFQELEDEITPNTKREIKASVEQLGKYFRQMMQLWRSSRDVRKTRPGTHETTINPLLQSMKLKVVQIAQDQTIFFQQIREQHTVASKATMLAAGAGRTPSRVDALPRTRPMLKAEGSF